MSTSHYSSKMLNLTCRQRSIVLLRTNLAKISSEISKIVQVKMEKKKKALRKNSNTKIFLMFPTSTTTFMRKRLYFSQRKLMKNIELKISVTMVPYRIWWLKFAQILDFLFTSKILFHFLSIKPGKRAE